MCLILGDFLHVLGHCEHALGGLYLLFQQHNLFHSHILYYSWHHFHLLFGSSIQCWIHNLFYCETKVFQNWLLACCWLLLCLLSCNLLLSGFFMSSFIPLISLMDGVATAVMIQNHSPSVTPGLPVRWAWLNASLHPFLPWWIFSPLLFLQPFPQKQML
jgi:hypothetical protein